MSVMCTGTQIFSKRLALEHKSSYRLKLLSQVHCKETGVYSKHTAYIGMSFLVTGPLWLINQIGAKQRVIRKSIWLLLFLDRSMF